MTIPDSASETSQESNHQQDRAPRSRVMRRRRRPDQPAGGTIHRLTVDRIWTCTCKAGKAYLFEKAKSLGESGWPSVPQEFAHRPELYIPIWVLRNCMDQYGNVKIGNSAVIKKPFKSLKTLDNLLRETGTSIKRDDRDLIGLMIAHVMKIDLGKTPMEMLRESGPEEFETFSAAEKKKRAAKFENTTSRKLARRLGELMRLDQTDRDKYGLGNIFPAGMTDKQLENDRLNKKAARLREKRHKTRAERRDELAAVILPGEKLVKELAKWDEAKDRAEFPLGPVSDSAAYCRLKIMRTEKCASWAERIEKRDALRAAEMAAKQAKRDAAPKPAPRISKIEIAGLWLHNLVADGWVGIDAIRFGHVEAGYSWRSVTRAKVKRGIISGRWDYNGGWAWGYPKDAPKSSTAPTNCAKNQLRQLESLLRELPLLPSTEKGIQFDSKSSDILICSDQIFADRTEDFHEGDEFKAGHHHSNAVGFDGNEEAELSPSRTTAELTGNSGIELQRECVREGEGMQVREGGILDLPGVAGEKPANKDGKWFKDAAKVYHPEKVGGKAGIPSERGGGVVKSDYAKDFLTEHYATILKRALG